MMSDKNLISILAILMRRLPIIFLVMLVANFSPSAFLGAKSQLVKHVICAFHSFIYKMHIYQLCSSWDEFWTFEGKIKIVLPVLQMMLDYFKKSSTIRCTYSLMSKNSKFLQTCNTVCNIAVTLIQERWSLLNEHHLEIGRLCIRENAILARFISNANAGPYANHSR